jgi:dihydroneopterin aldolase
LAAVDESAHPSVEVEVRGLSIYTHHGVTDAEQEVGQRLEFDLTFDVPDCDAVLTDRVEDTVDYSEVCDIVALAATERSYRTLERARDREPDDEDGV